MAIPDIKIFVSNRIDLDSTTIEYLPYINVRCGAEFDTRKNIEMIGDNTGEHISNKRMSFCELTVQYWAWKNVKADYYGLCHYRRYLSFNNELHKVSKSEHDNGCVRVDYLTDKIINEFKLTYDGVKAMIEKYDVIACAPIDYNKSNLEAIKASPNYHNIDDMYEAINIIHEKYPYMDDIVTEYMNSKKIRLYNCWLMRKDIFEAYSEWLFSILFELEKRIDISNYGIQKYRTPGTIGERLFGIYCLYLSKQKNIRFKDQELLFIEHPENIEDIVPYWGDNQITITSNFNNNYVKAFSVSLISILKSIDHNKYYEIIILTEDVSTENRDILESIVNEYKNVHLTFYNPFPILSGINLFIKHSVYSKDLFVRVIIPYALKNFEKVIVIDADTIVKKDIASLYDIDVNEYFMAAVRDVVYGGFINGIVPGTMEYTKNILKLENPYNYCNTGVIILNCIKIRQEFNLNDILTRINNQRYRIYEQDMLNVLFNNKILFLDPRWNVFTYTNSSIKDSVDMAPLIYYREYIKARENPYIIHYASQPKPWNKSDSDFSIEFWRYARLSPFYESLLCENSLGMIKIERLSIKNIIRNIANSLLPKGSNRREYVKKIYYYFRSK